jgi:hypothetical protein
MTVTLLPRLPGPSAERQLDLLFAGDVLRWNGYDPDAHPDGVRFGATGGTTISSVRLHDFRNSLVEVATASGFPDSSRAQNAAFDTALAGWIHSHQELHSGEALRDDVWTYVGVVMAPDIVHWRFGPSRERYLGGVRNTFQRVWLRARALDRGEGSDDRWGLLRELTEDALVAITERPAIGADSVLAKELAEGWVRAAGRVGRTRMEPIMRLATIRLRIRNEIQSLSTLRAAELSATVDEFFGIAMTALDVSQTGTDTSTSSRDEEASLGDAVPESPRTLKSRIASWRAR